MEIKDRLGDDPTESEKPAPKKKPPQTVAADPATCKLFSTDRFLQSVPSVPGIAVVTNGEAMYQKTVGQFLNPASYQGKGQKKDVDHSVLFFLTKAPQEFDLGANRDEAFVTILQQSAAAREQIAYYISSMIFTLSPAPNMHVFDSQKKNEAMTFAELDAYQFMTGSQDQTFWNEFGEEPVIQELLHTVGTERPMTKAEITDYAKALIGRYEQVIEHCKWTIDHTQERITRTERDNKRKKRSGDYVSKSRINRLRGELTDLEAMIANAQDNIESIKTNPGFDGQGNAWTIRVFKREDLIKAIAEQLKGTLQSSDMIRIAFQEFQRIYSGKNSEKSLQDEKIHEMAMLYILGVTNPNVPATCPVYGFKGHAIICVDEARKAGLIDAQLPFREGLEKLEGQLDGLNLLQSQKAANRAFGPVRKLVVT